MRIGIDVGGTHTDAVILDGDEVISATKALTSANVVSGITDALDTLLKDGAISQNKIKTVMIGTTQFTNAIVQRRELSPVAAVRIGLPSGRGIPPMVDWPDDIRGAMGEHIYLLHGGYLYDGFPVADIRDDEVDALIKDLVKKRIKNVAIASAFSPMNAQPEKIVGEKIKAAIPNARVTLSYNFGRLGLMERENAAIMNATLLPFADKVVSSFLDALKNRGLNCPAFISQNDGTLMSADFVRAYPALTFASGPTNSLRGAYKLTGLKDAIVVDIGGTTSDIGVLQGGFPRESNVVIEIGGVRTNFRMPDITAVGLGGGSLVLDGGKTIGPLSVGHKLVSEGLVFGGKTLTTTDILVASGGAKIGDVSKINDVPKATVDAATATMHAMLDQNIEMMKPGGKDMPVILVGGGAVLVTQGLKAASQLQRPENAGVANAIGAAIAQIGAEAERIISYRETPREEALKLITQVATERAFRAGADIATIKAVDIEETSIPYMDEGATRVRVKVIGDLSVGDMS
ncbi:hydantoinase/oxoprolinase family protein [Robiginitomaculum antarcticum]|uniref:hydantoinase/oxoprolinase family protein n=1 Tax=Robiginitomaculum antarcticum TaxID=437507 RepID=UPI00035FBE0E|nr:hydantoinase/oxoprolinase family protein [Robiginitomaculum antarcticum]